MAGGNLHEAVADMLADGASVEQVYLTLLSDGHTVDEIQHAMARARPHARSADLQTRVARIVLAVGAVLVGAGVFSFVAANWQGMSAVARVAVILLSLLVVSSAGFYLREYRGYRWTGESVLLLGSIVFGAGVFLAAQIFNIRPNWPDGFIIWMLGTIAMAAAVRSLSIYALAALVALVAAATYPAGLIFGSFLDVYRLTSPLLALAGALVALAGTVLLRRIHTPYLSGMGAAWAVILNLMLLLGLLGFVALGYTRHDDWLVTFGALLLFAFVIFKYFDWLFTFLDRSIAFVGAGLVLLLIGGLMERGRRYVISAMEDGHASR